MLPLDLPALDEETMFSETSLLSALLSFVLLPVDGDVMDDTSEPF
jgi:hypothetical protein